MRELRTIEQARASFALGKVRDVKEGRREIEVEKEGRKERKKVDKDKYKTRATRLSSMIVNNGLGPTMAFYKSKEETKPVYEDVEEWLKCISSNFGFDFLKENEDLLEKCLESQDKYRLLTAEVLAFTTWLKRMVEIELR